MPAFPDSHVRKPSPPRHCRQPGRSAAAGAAGAAQAEDAELQFHRRVRRLVPLFLKARRGGFLMAWDPVKQKEVWRGAGGAGGGGGTVTTAGNLVFQVIQQGGRLVAYSADKGELLLDIATGQTGNMGPPITYMLDGKQYVTLLGGNPCGGGGSGPAANYAWPSSVFRNSRQCSDECSCSRRSSRTRRICRNGPVRHASGRDCRRGRSRGTRRNQPTSASDADVHLCSGRKGTAVKGEFELSPRILRMYSVGPEGRPLINERRDRVGG